MAASNCAQAAYDLGLRKVELFIKGPGSGRESAIRTIQNVGIEITLIKDVTPLPHNGLPSLQKDAGYNLMGAAVVKFLNQPLQLMLNY